MKTIFFLFIIFFIQNLGFLHADDCGVVTNCPNKKYQYYFCISGKLVKQCSNNPLSEPNPPMKADYPVCLRFYNGNSDAAGPEEIIMKSPTGADLQVYRRDWNNDDGNKAAYELNCICGKQSEPCLCEIYYFFSSNRNDFLPNPKSTIARAFLVVSGSTCKTYCGGENEAVIKLNNAIEFTNSKPLEKRKRKFFYNDKKIEEDSDFLIGLAKIEYTVYNLAMILKHELAHMMGLGHHGECPRDVSSGIMHPEAEANEKNIPFSLDDICMFKKLYCPTLVPVDEDIVKMGKSQFNYPNPFKNFTIIKFTIDCEAPTKFNVYNQYGINVLSYEKVYQRGENTEYFDGSVLPCGIYYYTIENNGKLVSNKMIILK